ncbi:hypothetical protein VTO73DRAFT_13284 [Trametes versicolor]
MRGPGDVSRRTRYMLYPVRKQTRHPRFATLLFPLSRCRGFLLFFPFRSYAALRVCGRAPCFPQERSACISPVPINPGRRPPLQRKRARAGQTPPRRLKRLPLCLGLSSRVFPPLLACLPQVLTTNHHKSTYHSPLPAHAFMLDCSSSALFPFPVPFGCMIDR